MAKFRDGEFARAAQAPGRACHHKGSSVNQVLSSQRPSLRLLAGRAAPVGQARVMGRRDLETAGCDLHGVSLTARCRKIWLPVPGDCRYPRLRLSRNRPSRRASRRRCLARSRRCTGRAWRFRICSRTHTKHMRGGGAGGVQVSIRMDLGL